jgi:Lipase (class 3)
MKKSRSFDPAMAVSCAKLVELAYQMFEDDVSGIAQPDPPLPFPVPGYEFVAWVQMKDFILVPGPYRFYGLIAQSATDPNKFVLAIRGTETLEEMFDDLTAMALVDWENFGKVGFGFSEIYKTMRIVYPPIKTLGAESPTRSLERAPTFAHQVAAAVQRAAAARRQAAKVERHMSVAVTGHSLGAALATLYVAQSFHARLLSPPLICTFGSPMVGDSKFVKNFNRFGITSWRIVNEFDVIPLLPLPLWGFVHIKTLHLNKMTKLVRATPTCFHHIKTYQHLLDATQPLSVACQQPPMDAAIAPMHARLQPTKAAAALSTQAGKEVAVSVPRDDGATINITIKVGRTE